MMQLRTAPALSLLAITAACGMPPELVIIVQPESDIISGNAAILVEPADENALLGVELFIDGHRAASLTKPPFLFSVDTTTLIDGPHVFEAHAVMPDESTIEATRELVVDNLPPVITIDSPMRATVIDPERPQTLLLAIDVEDAAGVEDVRFFAGNEPVAHFASPPFVTTLDTDALPLGAQESVELRFEAVSRGGHAAVETLHLAVSRRTLWRKDFDSGVVGSPVLIPDGVVVATRDGTLRAFDDEGTPLWSVTLDHDLVAGPTWDARTGRLYLGDITGRAYIVSAAGEVTLRTDLGLIPGIVAAAPTPYDVSTYEEGLFVPMRDGRVLLLTTADDLGRTSTSERTTTFINDADALSHPVLVTPTNVGQRKRVVAQYESGRVVACELINGPCATPSEWIAPDDAEIVAGAVVAADGTMFVGDSLGRVHRFDPLSTYVAGGTFPWTPSLIADLDAPITSLTYDASATALLVTTDEGGILQLLGTGEETWSVLDPSTGWQTALPTPDGALAAGADGRLCAFSGAVAQSRWCARTDRGLLAPPAIAGALLFAGDAAPGGTSGALYAITID